jgi:putative membrane protein
MRTIIFQGISMLALAAVAVACGHDENRAPARSASPAGAATTHSGAWGPGPNDATSSNPHTARPPLDDPSPSRATLESPGRDTTSEPLADRTGAGVPQDRVLARNERDLSDAEVMGVVVAANNGEVNMAELAIHKASSADVKQFAAMMKSHHGAGLQKARTLQTKAKIDSGESDLSTYLKKDTDEALQKLRASTGSAFDRLYVETQVKAHRDVLAAIDNRLAPSAHHVDLRAMLSEMRKQVSDHLLRVEDIQKTMTPKAAAAREERPPEGSPTLGLGMPEPPATTTPARGKHEAQTKAKGGDVPAADTTKKKPPVDKQH